MCTCYSAAEAFLLETQHLLQSVGSGSDTSSDPEIVQLFICLQPPDHPFLIFFYCTVNSTSPGCHLSCPLGYSVLLIISIAPCESDPPGCHCSPAAVFTLLLMFIFHHLASITLGSYHSICSEGVWFDSSGQQRTATTEILSEAGVPPARAFLIALVNITRSAIIGCWFFWSYYL